MAWSDAARRAAAEVRRQHASAKSGAGRDRFLRHNDFNRKIDADKDTRGRIAKHLRAFRSGGKAMRASVKLGYTTEGIAAEARASTMARNVLKHRRR